MYLSLPELEALLQEAREQEKRQHRFMAAIAGIDLDAQANDGVQDRFEASKRRAQAVLQGKNVEQVELDEIEMDYEVEE